MATTTKTNRILNEKLEYLLAIAKKKFLELSDTKEHLIITPDHVHEEIKRISKLWESFCSNISRRRNHDVSKAFKLFRENFNAWVTDMEKRVFFHHTSELLENKYGIYPDEYDHRIVVNAYKSDPEDTAINIVMNQ
jgi:hypothetical protein